MKALLVRSAIAILALTLAGCVRHYSKALREYQQAEPTVFHRNTLAWIAQAEAQTSADEDFTPAMPQINRGSDNRSPADARLDVVAAVLAAEESEIAERLKDPQAAEDAAASDTLTWQELALAVAQHNPAVEAAAERWQASLAQYSQAEFLEGLIGQYRAFTRYLSIVAGQPSNKAMVQQFFPYPSAIALKGEMVAEQVRIASLEWRLALREALIEAGEAYYQYQYVYRAEATTRENVAIIEDLLEVIERRYTAGETAQADLLRVQTALERQRNALADLQSRQKAAAATLNATIGRDASAPLGPPAMENLSAETPDAQALIESAVANRQELRIQRARVERTSIALRMGEVMNRPLATQGYSLFERGMAPEASEGPMPESFGAMAMAPERPAFAQAEAYLLELRQRLRAEQSELEDEQLRTISLAENWLQELDMARRQVQLIEEIVLPQSRSAYEATLSGYTAGRVSFADLIDAERELLEARLELDQALRDLNQTLIRKGRITGQVPW